MTRRLGSTASAPPGPTSSSLANSVTSGASVRIRMSAVAEPTRVNVCSKGSVSNTADCPGMSGSARCDPRSSVLTTAPSPGRLDT